MYKHTQGVALHPINQMSILKFIRIHRLIALRTGAVALILIGLVALMTPLTPGSWLVPIGLGMLIGKKRTGELLMKIGLNKRSSKP